MASLGELTRTRTSGASTHSSLTEFLRFLALQSWNCNPGTAILTAIRERGEIGEVGRHCCEGATLSNLFFGLPESRVSCSEVQLMI